MKLCVQHMSRISTKKLFSKIYPPVITQNFNVILTKAKIMKYTISFYCDDVCMWMLNS